MTAIATASVSVETRRELFQKFWDLGHYDAQTAFIVAFVTESLVKRKRNVDSDKRTFTRQYKIGDQVVCRTIFVQTLRISTAFQLTGCTLPFKKQSVRHQ